MINNCKKKGCDNEALNGGKYCNYHQSKREDTKKMLIDGAVGLAAFTMAIVFNKPTKK